MLSKRREVISRGESAGKDKRKPVRRNPEKRRQQNVQAQKKYREKLRERLDNLEALAASATQSHATGRIPDAGADLLTAVTAYSPSSIPNHGTAQSLPALDAMGTSVSGSSAATPGDYQHHIPQSDDNPSEPCIWDSKIHINPSLLIRDKYNGGIGPYWTTTIDCGCFSPHVQIRTQGPDPFNYNNVRILSFGPSATRADPYANNLRVEVVCVTAALYTLGMYVGVTEEMLCADKSLSPFFRPSAESGNDMARTKTICAVQKLFKTLKPDLRPSSEQITVDHHPYIDILPFPTLRKNLITNQEEVDEGEFFNDALTGLVCWGGAGIGRRDREESTGYVSTGTPWDVRSWEAKLWFLKKYWTLLGGEDGELVRQSEWWRSIRGDNTLKIEEHN